ncbi:hypothetical protein [Oligella urethralis]|nr:hypothetical protein [Oligella urethralis]
MASFNTPLSYVATEWLETTFCPYPTAAILEKDGDELLSNRF